MSELPWKGRIEVNPLGVTVEPYGVTAMRVLFREVVEVQAWKRDCGAVDRYPAAYDSIVTAFCRSNCVAGKPVCRSKIPDCGATPVRWGKH